MCFKYRFIDHVEAMFFFFFLRMYDNQSDCDCGSLAVYFWKICTGKKIQLGPEFNIITIGSQKYFI